MNADDDERPEVTRMIQPDTTSWFPAPKLLRDLTRGPVLVSPAGRNHLHLVDDGGTWQHLAEKGAHRDITAGEAIQLRPADVDQVIAMSVLWTWQHGGIDNPRSMTLLDEVRAGVRGVLFHYAGLAGARNG